MTAVDREEKETKVEGRLRRRSPELKIMYEFRSEKSKVNGVWGYSIKPMYEGFDLVPLWQSLLGVGDPLAAHKSVSEIKVCRT